MIRRPPRSTRVRSSAASDVYKRQQGLSSRFVVVDRKVVWRSPVILTPYLPDNKIDADMLGEFVEKCYVQAGVERAAIDTGAVVLTGVALKRHNARAIAD